jgi:HTH-type transcriptional regulator/antitoxin HigA
MNKEMLPARAVKPGDILREEMEAREWSQGDLAQILGRPTQVVNEILQGRKAITPETALGLATAFGTSPEFWLNLENAYRLHLARASQPREEVQRRAQLYSLAPIKEMMKRGWIRETSDLQELEKELLRFYRAPNLQAIAALQVRFRFSASQTPDTPSLWAWVTQARNLAERQEVGVFEPREFPKEAAELSRISSSLEETSRLPGRLAEMGIRFVLVPHLPKTYADGAAFWLDENSPAVALSLRYDRVDNFWFTLMHELAHLGGATKERHDFLDNDLDQNETAGEEGRANRQASEWLLPRKAFAGFVRRTRPYFSLQAIRSFAVSQGVHPAIVVGRLHHEGHIPFGQLRGTLGRVRHLFPMA